MDYFQHLWQRLIDGFLHELWGAVTLLGVAACVLLVVYGHGGWAWVAVAATVAGQVFVGWLLWRRAGPRRSDVFGGASWAADLDAIAQSGLKARK